jgi:hypothetical protein
LACVADEIAVHFPWGSLLRGLVEGSHAVLGPIAHLMKTSAELRILRLGVGRARPAVVARYRRDAT